MVFKPEGQEGEGDSSVRKGLASSAACRRSLDSRHPQEKLAWWYRSVNPVLGRVETGEPPRDSLNNQHDPLQVLGSMKDSISNYSVESHRGRRAKLTSGLSVHARTPTKVKPQFSAI